MGIAFNLEDTLTTSQQNKARKLGITDDEMITRLKRIQGRENPDISIIIPVYNCEKYIEECVNSALIQTGVNYEVIVIDDGSTDGTLEKLLQIDGITVLVKPNGGTASALNVGIRNAKGRWIKWLSADDVLYPNALSEMLNCAIDENTIYYSHYHIIDADSNITGKFEEQIRETSQLWSFFFGNGSSSMIHRSVFERCGLFDEELEHSEDYEFWLRATQVYGVQMKLVPKFTLKYRRHDGQLTNRVGGSLDGIIKEKVKSLVVSGESEIQHPTG